MNKRPHVALLIETSRGHGRQIIEGVARYAAEHGSWLLRLEPRNIDDRPPRWLRTWQGDGIIVRCDTPQMARAVLETRIPVIDVRGGVPDAGLPLVGVDNAPVVEAAFEHFRQRRFRPFAWCEFFRYRQPLRSCKLDWHALRPISPKRNSRYKPLHREPASPPSSIWPISFATASA